MFVFYTVQFEKESFKEKYKGWLTYEARHGFTGTSRGLSPVAEREEGI
jgi:hypothetical protein